ncbi:hypothetical protein LEMLEM_LOCUS24960 [Lemmus lemmus]
MIICESRQQGKSTQLRSSPCGLYIKATTQLNSYLLLSFAF